MVKEEEEVKVVDSYRSYSARLGIGESNEGMG